MKFVDRERKKTCSVGEKLGFPGRTHPGESEGRSENKNMIKIANNTEWEERLNKEVTDKKKTNFPPLIVLRVNIEGTEANGFYDPGAVNTIVSTKIKRTFIQIKKQCSLFVRSYLFILSNEPT